MRTADADRKCKSKVGRPADADQPTDDEFVDSEWPHPTLDPQPQMRRIWRRRINLPYPAQKQSPLSSRPLFHSICPISLSLSTAPLMYVLHSTSTPACRPAERDRLFVCSLPLSFLLGTQPARCRSVGPSAACSWYHLPPPPSSLLQPPQMPPRRRRQRFGCGPRCRTLGSALQRRRAYLGKIKDGGHDSKHGCGGGQAREGGRAGNGGGPLRLVARSHSETEGREGEKMAAAAARRHLKNSLLCYAKDNNRYDTKDRLPTRIGRGGSNSDDGFIRSLAWRLDWRGSRATNCLGEGRMNRKCRLWHCVSL